MSLGVTPAAMLRFLDIERLEMELLNLESSRKAEDMHLMQSIAGRDCINDAVDLMQGKKIRVIGDAWASG